MSQMPPEMIAAILARYEQGFAAAKISVELGIRKDEVYKCLKSQGVQRKSRHAYNRVYDQTIENQVCQTYQSGKSVSQTSALTNVPYGRVFAILKKYGIKMHPSGGTIKDDSLWTENSPQEIADGYRSGIGINDLARKYGVSNSKVYNVLAEFGIDSRAPGSNRIYSLDQSVFENASIDPIAAYWVGFLMADGCVAEVGNSLAISMNLATIDANHVEKFRGFMKTDRPLFTNQPQSFDFPTRNGGKVSRMSTGSVGISISSVKIAKDLEKYGVVPRKSATAQVSILENNVHFWRGVIDGDGSVCFLKNEHRCTISLVGSPHLTAQFAEFCNLCMACTVAKSRKSSSGQYLHVTALLGPRAYRMIQILYGMSCPEGLQRKVEKAREILDTIKYTTPLSIEMSAAPLPPQITI